MKVYEAVANAFVKEGTSTVFGLLGDGQITWWTEMAKRPGVKLIDVRDEGAALTMAEGWAMATKRVGICSVTQGPGISRMATSLITATRSRTPIVVYTSKTTFNDENATQHLDQDRLVSATGAGYIEVLKPAYAEQAVREAFYRARREERPIVLCVPLDIQRQECDADGEEYQPSSRMFSGRQRIPPNPDRVQEAVRIISESKKPVVIVGRGAAEPDAIEAAKRLANRIGALTATSLMAKGAFGESEFHAGISGLFSTRAVMHLFEDADCVIAMGASLNTRTIEGGYLYPKARVVHIDVAPHVVMGDDRGADCYIEGDAALTTRAINEMLGKQGISHSGFHTASVSEILRTADRDPAEFEIESGTVDPREAIRVIDERLPSNVGVVTGCAHSFAFPVMGMKRPRPIQLYLTEFGCIGQAMAAAIGVGVALNQPIMYMEGDGGALQNIQELDTASRLGLKILFVILNDEAYAAEYHKMKAKGLDANLSVVRSPDFGAVGRGFGCRGRMAKSIDEVASAIDEFVAGDGPMVLDLRISRNVISIPYRRLVFALDA